MNTGFKPVIANASIDRVEGLFAELYQGNGPSVSDPIALAHAFVALIDSFWEQCMMTPDSVDLEESRRTCLSYLVSVLPGDQWPNPAPDLISSEAHRQPVATSNGMLSDWTYTSAELFEVEMAQLFRGQWLLVGHVADVVEPGDYLTFEAGVLRFHQRLKKEIPVMSLVHPPAPGTLVSANQAMRSGAARA